MTYISDIYSPDRVQKRYVAVRDGAYRCYEVDRQHRTIRELELPASAFPFWAIETAHLLAGAAYSQVLLPDHWRPPVEVTA